MLRYLVVCLGFLLMPISNALGQSLLPYGGDNAQVLGDDLYIRDSVGERIPGRYVANGDHIVVLDVAHSTQLALVDYPTPAGRRIGFVKNVPSLIHYYHKDEWQNGPAPLSVYDVDGTVIGRVDPYEFATPLYYNPMNNMFHIVYDTSKGEHTKSGYVVWHGNFSGFINAQSPCTYVPAPTVVTQPSPKVDGNSCPNIDWKEVLIGIGDKVCKTLLKPTRLSMPIIPKQLMDVMIESIIHGSEPKECPLM
jgi:hypothetical protein